MDLANAAVPATAVWNTEFPCNRRARRQENLRYWVFIQQPNQADAQIAGKSTTM
ncbi:hypothetical protein L505_4170 [Bordetella bronchiseptica F4563]|nr:hypothetical protein L505_4170 [Bordetella bronchiseptica F4563]